MGGRSASVWGRWAVGLPALGVSVFAAAVLGHLAGASGAPLAAAIAIGLIGAACLLSPALTLCSVVLGFFLPRQADGPADTTALAGRTAVLVPVRNEDIESLRAALTAMALDLADRPQAERFDIVILSDTNTDAHASAEARMVEALRAMLPAQPRLFYRRRTGNEGRKAGNVAEFVRRWGGTYAYLIVLDADSLMSARTMVRLALQLEAEPGTALIQTVPRILPGASPLARFCAFGASVYGGAFARGQALWQGSDGNFWGHNAIIRTRAFAECCGLPKLPGKPPFGGDILSHDFVEAALLRRAGWDVRLAPELDGSYEGFPPTVREFADRDRRWMQGNLQHLRLVAADGFKPMSRLHLLLGAWSYLTGPMWLVFIAAMLGLAYLPGDPDAVAAAAPLGTALLVLAAICLGVPRVLAAGAIAFDAHARRAHGGVGPLVSGFAGEVIVSAMAAPILAVLQTRALIALLARRDAGWGPQSRTAGGLDWASSARLGVWPMAAGGVLFLAAWAAPGALGLAILPVLAGLLLAVPVIKALSSAALGRAAASAGLWLIPEEVASPRIVAAAEGARAIEPPCDAPEPMAQERAPAA